MAIKEDFANGDGLEHNHRKTTEPSKRKWT